ncbi:hypothetical protein MNBD_NITROSPIRAE01-1764 [hydrothermal vent metagenome]|uniref:Nuclear transport factor 2 family protein n=1 Tax=hydrothermal vent metagenome TaxID=652676 RepID=A0A3B1CS71_9ZZZZ
MFYSRKQQGKNSGLLTKWILLFALFFLSACASDPKRASPIVTQVGQIQKSLKHLSKAYEKRDESAFFKTLDADSKLLDALKDGIKRDFERFTVVTLSFVIDHIVIKENVSQTTLRWQGRWTLPSSSEAIEKRGKVIFSWVNRDHPKLTEIRGDSPFGSLPRP